MCYRLGTEIGNISLINLICRLYKLKKRRNFLTSSIKALQK